MEKAIVRYLVVLLAACLIALVLYPWLCKIIRRTWELARLRVVSNSI